MERNGLLHHRLSRSMKEPRVNPEIPRKSPLTRLGSGAPLGEGSKRSCRLVVLGAEQVGKSAIIRQFLHAQFSAEYSATLEELHRAEVELETGRNLTLDILDTSGSHEFPAMRRLAIASGDAFVLVYSVTDPSSFEEAREVYGALKEARGPPTPPVVVVGNKLDLPRKVPREMAETVACCDWECGFVECSAKTGDRVAEIFDALLLQANVRLRPANRRRSLPATPVMPPRHRLGKRNSCGVS